MQFAKQVGRATDIAVTDKKLHFVVVTQGHKELLEQLKTGFKRKINLNKYQPRVSTQAQNQCSDYLIDSSSQRLNRLFVLSFEENAVRTGHTE